jgi:nitrate/TMAO reductase-like tetraheme cytochrome c subunit
VYQEYTDTIHYTNRTGVRATCPDCHVPKDWVHKFVRKIQATNELYHHFKGDWTRRRSSRPSASVWRRTSGVR